MRRLLVIGLCVMVFGLAASDSHAEADIGVKGAGARLSFVSPSDIDATIGFGGIVNLGTFTPEIGFEATVDYWSKSEGSGQYEVKFRDIALGARGTYMFQVSDERLKPYAAAGLAIHLFKSEVPAVTFLGTTIGGDVSDTKIGVDLAGGLGYAAGDNVDVVGEIMYRIVSDVGQFCLSGGVVFWFGS